MTSPKTLNKTYKFFFASLALALLIVGVAHAADLININTADIATLETLSGIGASKAQAIITYRTQNGAFAAIADIQNVSGIGPATYANIKDFITVGDTAQSDASTTTTATSSEQSDTQGGTQTQTQAESQTQTAPVDSYVPPPLPQVFADAGSDETVIAGADVAFDGRAYDRSQTMLTNARFIWNFGDGSVAEGASVMHHFTYPGTYAVVLSVADDAISVEDEITVTAEPAKLSFSLLPSGGVSIQNLAGHDLDLSGWLIAQGGQRFMLPLHSTVLSSATMQLAEPTLGFWSNITAELEYPNGAKVLGAGESTPDSKDSSQPKHKLAGGGEINITPTPPPTTFAPAIRAPASPAPATATASTTIEAADFAAAAAESDAPVWLFALGTALLAIAGAGAIGYTRYFKPETPAETSVPGDGFEIE